MNKTLLALGVVGLVVIGGVVAFVMRSSPASGTTTMVSDSPQTPAASPAAPASSSTVLLMQSTGTSFAQYKYASKAHEIFPTPAADIKTALGAFSYSKTDLGGGATRFTLTNSAEGYKGQSVVVGTGQKLYFVEPSLGDDSPGEDSITTDDFFVVVDAQGNILK